MTWLLGILLVLVLAWFALKIHSVTPRKIGEIGFYDVYKIGRRRVYNINYERLSASKLWDKWRDVK